MSRPEGPEGPGAFQLVVGTVPLTVARDGLLTLDDAVDLPRLGGQFTFRDLRRFASPKRTANRLDTIMSGRRYMTTPDWIHEWIEAMRASRRDHRAVAPVEGQAPAAPISVAAAAPAASLEARLAPSPPKAKTKPKRKET